MTEIVFLVEEPSMQVLLDGLLPRLLPQLRFRCVPHEGKQDLERSIPRKLRAWRTPGVRFVVVRDNDGGDCFALKRRLADLCREGRREDTVIRIACQELEAWYLGEPEALAVAFADPRLADLGRQSRYRDADAVPHPALAVAQLVPEFQKVMGARRMAAHLSETGNHSRSFRALLAVVRRLAEAATARDEAAPAADAAGGR